MPVQVRHYCEAGHYKHVGTCPACQRRALKRVKGHVIQATIARVRWEREQQAAKHA